MKKIFLMTLFLATTCLFAQSNNTKLFTCSAVGIMDGGYIVHVSSLTGGGYQLDLYQDGFSEAKFMGSENVKIQKKATHYEITQINDKDNNHMLLTLYADNSAYFYIEFNGSPIAEFLRSLQCETYVNLSNYIK